ncbi:MAG: four helix bundle protein [Ferruginibacter sp.]
MDNDIKYRCYQFSLSVIRFLKAGKWDSLSLVIVKQLMRSASSVGANVVEAKNSSSRIEFKRYYEIALKSCNESKYWICLLRDGFDKKDEELNKILKEADEISRILASSIIKLKKAKQEGQATKNSSNN